ncbi:hypothetical protein H0274_01420 [Altererythrobacter sp. CC-YST694]|uniref:hypothetical protein n=1 Tax=Altererythrobacter sp. CC-YST694 TaxID=2755038 RepID=UPI001D00737D|nr:hypothetical protein [Altererythrobacter sp. CC-YST694]MCB5423903.1 hypothetical protein [Altererythrobacter sp. CC-YST694]
MRKIDVSTEVFAKIWAQRIAGEESEDEILKRLLGVKAPDNSQAAKASKGGSIIHSALWRQDVRQGLQNLGGSGHLKDIYQAVRDIRRKHGRSIPPNFEAIVRRELEQNSADAGAYLGKRNWFRSVDGIGSGIWAVREESEQ